MFEKEITELQNDIDSLRKALKIKEEKLHKLLQENVEKNQSSYSAFTVDDVSRYSRQMLIPQFGIRGQKKLKESKVLIVGTGGLGCPAALYLAAAGVGEITLVDNDVVDITNLHRQVLHSEIDLGMPKVHSAFETLMRINSSIKIVPLHIHADSKSIMDLLKNNKYNVVIDGTDNVATRYLLNDTCVLNKVPLVSGSALQMEGQLTVYNYKGGPCYRCLFPKPPPPNTVTSCGDGGVLGVVPGLIGILEALEAIKIISEMSGVLSGRLLLFDGLDTNFRNVKLRNKKSECEVCGSDPVILAPIDYEQFCGAKAHDKVEHIDILKDNENINVTELSNKIQNLLLIDVRPSIEYEMCSLPNSLNIPYDMIQKHKLLPEIERKLEHWSLTSPEVYVICRRGNDSQRAVSLLRKEYSHLSVNFINVRGGLHAYSKQVDSSFPIY